MFRLPRTGSPDKESQDRQSDSSSAARKQRWLARNGAIIAVEHCQSRRPLSQTVGPPQFRHLIIIGMENKNMYAFQPKPIHSEEILGDKLIITIPTQKMQFSTFFLPMWLFLWTIGGIFVISEIIKKFSFFMLFWLCGWLAGEVIAIYFILWLITGKEIIEVSSRSIVIRYHILGMNFKNEYLWDYVSDMRIFPHINSPWTALGIRPTSGERSVGISRGDMAFYYREKTVRFGNGIEEAEEKQILSSIQQRFSQYQLKITINS
jgi:hypothetical protein